MPPELSSAASVPETTSSSAVVDATSAPVATPPSAPAWVDLVRLERYREAHEALEALPDADKSTPEMRFLRARVASEIGATKLVRPILEGVDVPMFAEEIAALRAEAALVEGPFEEAIAFYEKRGSAADLAKAGRAALASGDAKRALSFADRSLVLAQKQKRPTDERRAHDLRVKAHFAKNTGGEATTSLKWLATNAPSSKEGKDAIEKLPPAALTNKEKREVIDALLAAGAGKEAIERIDLYASAFSKTDLAHLRATAEFKARRYKAAADSFLAAAKNDSERAPEQLYYAARSLARSKREDDAEKRYLEIEKRFKKGLWVERASYQRASLLLSQNKFDAAAKAYTSYLAKYADSKDRDEAEYALALSLLSADQPAKAKTVFAKMADRAKKTDWGFLRQLEGVAALRAKDQPTAVKLFVEVAKEQPLTWAAAMARARLQSLDQPAPPIIAKPIDQAHTPLALTLPPKARTLVSLGLDQDAEAWLSSNESTASAMYTNRETEALCGMYGLLSRAKRRYKVGAQAVSFDSLMRAPTNAERWSWECLYPAPYSARVRELEETRKLPNGFVHAIMRQESAFDPDARSPVGASGLMQLMPTTAAEAAKETAFIDYRPEEVTVPDVNLRLGSFYLEKMLGRFDGSLPLAAAAYNAGPQAVSRWVETAKEFEADVFVARIPYEETRNYTMKVMSNLFRYQWMLGGESAVHVPGLTLPTKTNVDEDDY